MSNSTPLGWRLKRWFWARWQAARFALSKPQRIGAPGPSGAPVDVVPLAVADSRIPIAQVPVYARLPKEEARLAMRALVRTGLWLTRLVPPMREGLPEVDADPHRALDRGLTRPYRRAFRAPVRPEAFEVATAPVLEDLAVRGPYSILLERDGGVLVWDLRVLDDFEHHPHVLPLGVRVVFAEQPDSPGLRTERIESTAFGTVGPGDTEWDAARVLAVCAATTHIAMIRHFCYVHLISGNHWDVATRNHLPTDHPLYRLVWPHFFNSLYTNHGVTRPQLLPDGDFVNMFSFTHAGLAAYYDAMYPRYDIAITDPVADWRRRGLQDEAFATPSHVNLVELFTVMHDHALRYVETYYASDDDLRADADVAAWLAALDELIPNGLGLDRPPSRAALARLIGGYIYDGNTIHDLVGTTLWDYQLWVDHNPTRVARNGRRVPVDVFQRVINNNFALQLRRAPLLADYGAVALDDRGAALFTQFFDDCTALQQRYDRSPAGPWRMEPRNLEINMNG